MEAGFVIRETWESFISIQSVLSENTGVSHDTSRLAPNKKTQEKRGDHGSQTKRVKYKKYKRTERDCARAWCMNKSQKYSMRGEGELKEGGKARARRGRSQTWSQVQSQVLLWFIMKKFQGEEAESKPEVTERRARARSLPSYLPLHPSFSALSVARSPSLWIHSSGLCGPRGPRGACLPPIPNGIPKHSKSTREIGCLHIM